MSVRRLAPDAVQPASFEFRGENVAWVEALIAKYPPGKQASAVIPMMMRAQEQDGWVTKAAIEWIAAKLGMAKIRVLEVATFYTQFLLAPVGSVAHVQVCGTTPCMLRGSDEILSICKSRIHHDPFHVSDDGKFSWEEVECLGACVNAPMVAVFKDTYEDLTPDSFNALLDGFASGNPPKPGPQNGRHGALPEGGATTLTDPELYKGAYLVNLLKQPTVAETPAAAVAEAPAPAPVAAEAATRAAAETQTKPAAKRVRKPKESGSDGGAAE